MSDTRPRSDVLDAKANEDSKAAVVRTEAGAQCTVTPKDQHFYVAGEREAMVMADGVALHVKSDAQGLRNAVTDQGRYAATDTGRASGIVAEAIGLLDRNADNTRRSFARVGEALGKLGVQCSNASGAPDASPLTPRDIRHIAEQVTGRR